MSGVDLEVLRRSEPQGGGAPPRRGKALIVGALVLGVLGWGFLLAKDAILPARVVTTQPVRVETGRARLAAVVQSAGWIEPDPFPVVVRPLVDGVVESVDVVEGDRVVAGKTVLARLRSAEIEARVEKAESELAHVASHVPEVKADIAQAEAALEQRIELRREEARLAGEVALAEADVAAASAAVRSAEEAQASAQADVGAQEELERRGAGQAVPLAKARSALRAAAADVDERRAARAKAEAARDAAKAEHGIAKEALEHPRELEAALASKRAHLVAATADVRSYEVERDLARRDLDRLVVRSPADGVVLRREAAPGSVVGPGTTPRSTDGARGDPGMGGVVSLYDPTKLQARVDVLFASAGGISSVGPGRHVELTTDALPGRTFHGVVTRVVSEADALKASLQVKVRIEDPDPLLKPETIVTARFLADERAGTSPAAAVRILVPRRALKGDAVFVIDPRGGGRARRVPVRKVAEDGDWVEVEGDLSATHHAILDDVADGQRVTEATS